MRDCVTLNRFSSTVYPGGLFGGTRLIYGYNIAVINKLYSNINYIKVTRCEPLAFPFLTLYQLSLHCLTSGNFYLFIFGCAGSWLLPVGFL